MEGRGTSEAAGQGGVGLEKDEYNPIIYYCHPVIDFELAYHRGVITIFKYIILFYFVLCEGWNIKFDFQL